MDIRYVLFTISLVMGAIVVLGFIMQDIYLMRKIKQIERKNAELRKENIGLMRHNGKLYDENQTLKSITEENIPDFKPW